MASYTVFGDAEAAVIEILGDAPQTAGATAAPDLTGYDPGDRWIRVARIGGLPTLWLGLDNPIISLAVYAEDKGSAHDLAAAARGAIFARSGEYSGFGLVLFDVNDAEGMAWSTEVPEMPHYTLSLSLVTRPA